MPEEIVVIRVGDLVRWEAGEKTRAGVVTSANPDGTCSINVQTPVGTIAMRIRSQRLERIVSTVAPLAPLAGDNLFPLFAKPAILALGDFLI
jgi:hypothetical protein